VPAGIGHNCYLRPDQFWWPPLISSNGKTESPPNSKTLVTKVRIYGALPLGQWMGPCVSLLKFRKMN
jgi:hypothetical protein